MPEVEIADRWTEPEAGEPPFSRGQALPGYIPDFKANEAVWGWVREEGPGICVWEARPCYSRGSNFLSGLPSRSGEVKRRLPDGPAIKSRRAPAILPDQFRLLRKCTFHLGFSLGCDLRGSFFCGRPGGHPLCESYSLVSQRSPGVEKSFL